MRGGPFAITLKITGVLRGGPSTITLKITGVLRGGPSTITLKVKDGSCSQQLPFKLKVTGG